MSNKLILILLISFAQICCKKKNEEDQIKQPPPPPVFLKDISFSGLPSPYYHFEYDAHGGISFVSVESGFKKYDMLYLNGRIADIRNNIIINKDTLRYSYNQEGLPTIVNYIDGTGIFRKCEFSYGDGRLKKMVWALRIGGNFEPERTLNLTYYPDGNVQMIAEVRHAMPGRPELIINREFSEYDNKINTDGFSLLHDTDNSDHLLLFNHLPIQKNNPAKLLYSGSGLHYQILYSYQYNQKDCPVSRQGQLTMLSGPRKGEQFTSNTSYSYFP